MSVLAAYLHKEAHLKKLQQELEALEKDDRYQHEKHFSGKLTELMEAYGKSNRDVVTLLSPNSSARKAPERSSRRLRRYTNPYSHEVVEARSSNHTTLKEWKKEYGVEVVKSWAEIID